MGTTISYLSLLSARDWHRTRYTQPTSTPQQQGRGTGCARRRCRTAPTASRPSIIVHIKGKPRRLELSGWEARVFQHEYDHLEGKLYATDRLDEAESARVQEQPTPRHSPEKLRIESEKAVAAEAALAQCVREYAKTL